MSHNKTTILEISESLVAFISDNILADGTRIDVEQNLLSDGMVDSLGMLRLVGYIETSYEMKIPPDQFTIQNFRNIDSISTYVNQLLSNKEM